jgi:hypothetical protein
VVVMMMLMSVAVMMVAVRSPMVIVMVMIVHLSPACSLFFWRTCCGGLRVCWSSAVCRGPA